MQKPDIVTAQPEDIPAWLALTAEVEPLFGPMLNDPSFHQALVATIARGSALCVRQGNGPAGRAVLGGLLYSLEARTCTIGWLAVTQTHRRHGIGQRLLEQVRDTVEAGELVVTTFGPDHPEGQPARRLYEKLGFHAAETVAGGPDGIPRQVFRHVGEAPPCRTRDNDAPAP